MQAWPVAAAAKRKLQPLNAMISENFTKDHSRSGVNSPQQGFASAERIMDIAKESALDQRHEFIRSEQARQVLSRVLTRLN